MYDRRLIRSYMRRSRVTVAEINRYRHLHPDALIYHATAQRDGITSKRLSQITWVIETCRIEARRAVFAVCMRIWKANQET